MGCGTSTEISNEPDDVKTVKSSTSTLSASPIINMVLTALDPEPDVSQELPTVQISAGIAVISSSKVKKLIQTVEEHPSLDVIGIIEEIEEGVTSYYDSPNDYTMFIEEQSDNRDWRIFGLDENDSKIKASEHDAYKESDKLDLNSILDYVTTEINELDAQSNAEETHEHDEQAIHIEECADNQNNDDIKVKEIRKIENNPILNKENAVKLILLINNLALDESKKNYLEKLDSFEVIKTRAKIKTHKCLILFVHRKDSSVRKFNFEFNIFLSNELKNLKYDPYYFLIFGSFLFSTDNPYGFSEFNDTLDEFNLKILNDEFETLHNGAMHVYFIGHKNDNASDIKQFLNRYEAMTGKIKFRSN